jgi:hypothetical protein
VLVKIGLAEGRVTRTVGLVHRRGRSQRPPAQAFMKLFADS